MHGTGNGYNVVENDSMPKRNTVSAGWLSTRRSMLLRAKQLDKNAQAALCQVYWQPVYGFVRAHNIDPELAQDITQGVFDNLLRRDLRTLDLERGSRFRSWLKRVVRSHLFNVLKSSRRASRVEVSVENEVSSCAASLVALDTVQQDRLFDQRTALALIDRAWDRLRRGKYAEQQALFEHLRKSLCGEDTELTDSQLSQRLYQCESYVRASRKRLKDGEFPEAMRGELRDIGVTEQRLDEELRALCEALG
jgi:DNA-directed RNA polymerase specialized sigma24 family protein